VVRGKKREGDKQVKESSGVFLHLGRDLRYSIQYYPDGVFLGFLRLQHSTRYTRVSDSDVFNRSLFLSVRFVPTSISRLSDFALLC
jgi:hypothetical protein